MRRGAGARAETPPRGCRKREPHETSVLQGALPIIAITLRGEPRPGRPQRPGMDTLRWVEYSVRGNGRSCARCFFCLFVPTTRNAKISRGRDRRKEHKPTSNP